MEHPHGTPKGYTYHFMDTSFTKADFTPCQPCRDAHAEYRTNLKNRKYLEGVDSFWVPALGAQRRIRALQRMGYPLRYIGIRLGAARRGSVAEKYVHNILLRDKMHLRTFQKLAALYDEVSHIPGPSTSSQKRAISKGYPAPGCWDDIDDPACEPKGMLA